MYASWHGEVFSGKHYDVHKRPWVARLVGVTKTGQLQRQFVRALHDYTHGEAHHSRGVYLYFVLAPGLYDFFRPISWRRDERFFGRVSDDGCIQRITMEEVLACLSVNTSA
jgi:hypothetical protein